MGFFDDIGSALGDAAGAAAGAVASAASSPVATVVGGPLAWGFNPAVVGPGTQAVPLPGLAQAGKAYVGLAAQGQKKPIVISGPGWLGNIFQRAAQAQAEAPAKAQAIAIARSPLGLGFSWAEIGLGAAGLVGGVVVLILLLKK